LGWTDAGPLLQIAWRGNMRSRPIQLQRHGDRRSGRRKARQPHRSTPTTHRRRPSCRQPDSRFIADWPSRDPIGNFARNNLYGFVANNPLTYLDPDGRKTWVPCPYPGHWVDDPQPPPPPPTNAPPIDCSGYNQYKNSSCVTCGGWGSKKKDTYPEKAQKMCEGFAKIYTGASNQSNAACVASCLIKAEAAIQAFPNCSDRNCFHLLAHIACYKDSSFWPDQGLPPGGPSVGALDLLPSATLSPYSQKLVIPPQYWWLW